MALTIRHTNLTYEEYFRTVETISSYHIYDMLTTSFYMRLPLHLITHNMLGNYSTDCIDAVFLEHHSWSIVDEVSTCISSLHADYLYHI